MHFSQQIRHTAKNFNVLKFLIFTNIIVFVLDRIFTLWFKLPIVVDGLALVPQNYIFRFWTFVTYSFVHCQLGHIFFNLLCLYFVGSFLLKRNYLSNKKFLFLYFLGVIFGALLWTGIVAQQNHILIGASAGVASLLMYFCHSNPNKQITVLFFFFIPIQLKAKWLAYLLWGYEVFNCLFYELPGLSTVASSAHIGGMIVGFLFTRNLNFHKNKKRARKQFEGNFQVNLTENSNNCTQEEIDQILDKVLQKGLGSLSEEERNKLANYRMEQENTK